ncbi:DUF4468 domain-containing protein [Mucilaginibacter sp. BJC16-A38]|uniref:DUF4468 domain-containing protein n=1 Tax=Mucilaginibacter phenanthrenivorans TaxID=1234842 RepID=UPI0021582ABC|nr:DUF4468 domain-containing protein [Mucilaginibacter phenanthrenivorans]MCR8558029.1 DUF4468 domain-containing protein [Mucilaginibacter phenanthrenivorans]
MVRKILAVLLFLLLAKVGIGQTSKDSIVYNLPVINGKLVYADSIIVKGHDKAILDTTAKKWFKGYFKVYRPDTLAKDKDTSSVILNRAGLEFRIATTSVALVKYDFYLIFSIKINCKNGYYTYRISDIFFVPKKDFYRRVIYYQSSPDYLIGLYKQKHLGFANSINLGRKKIREYLKCTDDTIRACIASLNKTMVN